MAAVYLGYHILTRAFVAIKVIDSHTADLKMVYREIELMQALEHEHINGKSSPEVPVSCISLAEILNLGLSYIL